MADEKKLAQARTVFDTLCQALDHNDWHYDKDETDANKLAIECGAQGDDLPMSIIIKVLAERQLVMLISKIPFTIQEDKRLDLALAVSAINNRLVDGSFDYNVSTGRMFFRMTNSFIESTVSEELFSYMLYCSCKTIDKYNDKFLMIAKGVLPLEQFLASLNN